MATAKRVLLSATIRAYYFVQKAPELFFFCSGYRFYSGYGWILFVKKRNKKMFGIVKVEKYFKGKCNNAKESKLCIQHSVKAHIYLFKLQTRLLTCFCGLFFAGI